MIYPPTAIDSAVDEASTTCADDDLPGERQGGAIVPRRRSSAVAAIVITAALGAAAQIQAPPAAAAPAPEVEYTYDVVVRRHYDFPNNDVLGYGYGISDKVTQGKPYATVMGEVKSDLFPNDEQAANYLVSYAVNILCPAQIWQLRNSAANYRPPTG